MPQSCPANENVHKLLSRPAWRPNTKIIFSLVFNLRLVPYNFIFSSSRSHLFHRHRPVCLRSLAPPGCLPRRNNAGCGPIRHVSAPNAPRRQTARMGLNCAAEDPLATGARILISNSSFLSPVNRCDRVSFPLRPPLNRYAKKDTAFTTTGAAAPRACAPCYPGWCPRYT